MEIRKKQKMKKKTKRISQRKIGTEPIHLLRYLMPSFIQIRYQFIWYGNGSHVRTNSIHTSWLDPKSLAKLVRFTWRGANG